MNNYDDRQISTGARYQNGIEACKITNVNKEYGLELETPSKQKIKLYPKDFEIFEYETGMYVDCVVKKENGSVVSAQRIGMTPEVFIPEQ